MNSSTMQLSIRRLCQRLAVPRVCEESDAQLLSAFVSNRDESSFAALVRRHGPMVLHVCLRVLGHQQDAEDAFQATFLVLACNAAAVRKQSSLASFLHGTAYRTALKAKQTAARRRKQEGSLGALTQPRSPIHPAEELLWREVRAALDEEIARLPEIYRGVFVLCCLENLSQTETAARLGLKERTVSNRLARARKRLSERLARRGVQLTAVLAAVALVTPQASALPAGLMAKTMKVVLAAASGKELAGVVSASLAELVKSVGSALTVSKIKVVAASLVMILLAGAGLWACRSPSALAVSTPAERQAKEDDKPKIKPNPAEAANTRQIRGQVLDPEGKPLAGAKLQMLKGSGEIQQLGVTGADGRFTVTVPKQAKNHYLLAQSDGTGLDFLDFSQIEPNKPIELRLVKDHAIRGRVVNTEGKPVAGVRVGINSLNVYANNSLDSFLVMWKKRHFMSGVPQGKKHLWIERAALLPATTDAEGRFTLRGAGNERFVELRFSGAGIAEVEAWVVNRAGFDPQPYNQATRDNVPKGFERGSIRWILHGPQPSIVSEAEKPIRGTVQDADSGKGRPGVVVRLTRINRSDLVAPIVEAKTDAQGRYEIHGVRKTKRYMVEISADTEKGYVPCQVWADDTPGYQPLNVDIKTKKGVVITGKVIDGGTGKPIVGFAMASVLNENPFARNYPSFDNSAWFARRDSDADGTFRVVAIAGPVLLMGGPRHRPWAEFKMPVPDPKYPQYFSTRIPYFPEFHMYGGGSMPVQGSYCKVLDIKPNVEIIKQDIVLERTSVLPVHIQDGDGKPLAGVWVTGNSPADWRYPEQCSKAECSAYELEAGKPRLLVFFHMEKHLAGTLTLKGDEKEAVTVKLGAPGSIKGRLLDADGKPLAGLVVDVTFRQRVATELHNSIHRTRQIVTDANGAFALEDLIPQQPFTLSFRHGRHNFERTPKPARPTLEVKAGECRDLGTIKLKPVPEPGKE